MSIPNKTATKKFMNVMNREAYAITVYVKDHYKEMDQEEIRNCRFRIVDLVQSMNSMIANQLLEDEELFNIWKPISDQMWGYSDEVRSYMNK